MQCQLCKISVAGFDAYLNEKSTEELIESVAETICMDHVIDDINVCKGAINEMEDIIIPVLTQSVFSPDYFCGEFLGYCTDENYYVFYAEAWVEQLLSTKPDIIKDNNYLNNIYKQIAASPQPRKTIRAV